MFELRKTRGGASATETAPSDTSRRRHQGDARRDSTKAHSPPAEVGPSTIVTISPGARALYQAEVVEQAAKSAAAQLSCCYNNTIRENIVALEQSRPACVEATAPVMPAERQSRPCRTILLK